MNHADAPEAPLQSRAMRLEDVPQVVAIEQASHSDPWTSGNFIDSIQTGCYMPLLLHGNRIVAYLVALAGVEEAHLLNVTVHPQRRGQGLGRLLLHALDTWALGQGARQIWLEVRQSNLAAQHLYRRAGYLDVAVRKHYYAPPPGAQQREHALVMRKPLDAAPPG
ncbi:hypothetical protein AAV94_01195 [Lampropedia cohaerens]|uniref:[Ribosomal protein bS18]-alanine N-acetyltransferase n=1 Tax=Lampropedia cohaerens TaxID=1610491 RepID=A0A0U1Q2T6_9BURK|nr:ribosomal protein S18-alanine N-acetyltransferase [Lampropedia cohaerens]KKW69054.1 hypothetical protein AAV94_01195 [Lampropedia cohaerens]